MASRLSEYALKEVYDSGLRGLPWQVPANSTALQNGSTPSLRAIMEGPDADAVIKALEPLDLYRAIKTQGIEDLIEVLPLISEEQHVRIMDYEAWQGSDLVPEKAFSWLKMFREVSHEEFFGRFKTLDEEYQLALLTKYLTVIDQEEYEKLSSGDQDQYTTLPCNELFYRVDTESPQIREFVEALIQAGLIVDLPYTYSLITHSSFMPPNEDELKINQFRKARLEEDGFVDSADARAIFVPLRGSEVEQLRSRYAVTAPADQDAATSLRKTDDGSRLIVDLALALLSPADGMAQRLAHTINTVAAAAGVSPDELQSLDQVVLLSKSILSLALDDLSEGNVETAAKILSAEHPTQLIRYGFALAQAVRLNLAERLAASGLTGTDPLPRMVSTGRLGEVLLRVEQFLLPILGLDSVEYLKGVFNRFPMVVKHVVGAEQNQTGKIVFEPVQSVASLRAAAAQVEGILEEILALREKMVDQSLDFGDGQSTTFESHRIQ